MQQFIESLKKGRLTTTRCLSCRNLIWPPSNICSKCLSDKIGWIEVDTNGKLLEFTESLIINKPGMFGVVELNGNIRLLGKISCKDHGELKKGMMVKLVKCGMESDDVYYEFQPM